MSSIFLPDPPPPRPERKAAPDEAARDDGEGEGEGEAGSEAPPALKPTNLAALFDPTSLFSDGVIDGTSSVKNERIGDWEFRAGEMLLYNVVKHKKLQLEQLDTPTKMMKVIVALATQTSWDSENLVRAMDCAARKKFGKTLYQIVNLMHDDATIDWVSGQIKPDAKPQFNR